MSRVRLLDAAGVFIREIEESEAHTLIREQRARGIGSKRTISVVQLTVARAQAEDHGVPCRTLLPSGLVGTRYSHDHASDDNPENVWTLKHIGAKDAATDLHIHLCHVDSLLAAMTPRERACFIEGLGVAHGVPERDLKRFLEPSESTGKR